MLRPCTGSCVPAEYRQSLGEVKMYPHTAMAFSFFVELLNTKLRKKEGAVQPKPEA